MTVADRFHLGNFGRILQPVKSIVRAVLVAVLWEIEMAKSLMISGMVILALSGCICARVLNNAPEKPERMILYYDGFNDYGDWSQDFEEIFLKTVNENIEEFLKKGYIHYVRTPEGVRWFTVNKPYAGIFIPHADFCRLSGTQWPDPEGIPEMEPNSHKIKISYIQESIKYFLLLTYAKPRLEEIYRKRYAKYDRYFKEGWIPDPETVSFSGALNMYKSTKHIDISRISLVSSSISDKRKDKIISAIKQYQDYKGGIEFDELYYQERYRNIFPEEEIKKWKPVCIKYDVENLELFELESILVLIIKKILFSFSPERSFLRPTEDGQLVVTKIKETPESVKWHEDFEKTAWEAILGYSYKLKLPENTIVLYEFQITAEDRFQHFSVIAPLVDSLQK